MTVLNPKEIHDALIMKRVQEHYKEALQYFSERQIVGIFLQGSQNYGLDYEGSDVDTKLIIAPSFKEVAMNEKPVSTTHIRANEEHIDFKDIRLYIDTFRKQNLNFLEILFTPYAIINPLYESEWNRLVQDGEKIARMNPRRAIQSMKGIALEKYHAMEHPYPSKLDILAKWGYDPKQLHHLLRVEEYLGRYIDGESYANCLRPHDSEYLKSVKLGCYDLDTARVIAETAKSNVERVADIAREQYEDKEDSEALVLLKDVQYNIMKIAIGLEFKED